MDRSEEAEPPECPESRPTESDTALRLLLRDALRCAGTGST